MTPKISQSKKFSLPTEMSSKPSGSSLTGSFYHQSLCFTHESIGTDLVNGSVAGELCVLHRVHTAHTDTSL